MAVVPDGRGHEATRRAAPIGALVVLDEDRRVAGLLTEQDVVRALNRQGPQLLEQPVEGCMSHGVPVCHPGDTLPGVMRTMTEWRSRHLPVLHGGELVGLISIGDVVRARLQEVELESAVLRDVVISHG